MALSRYQPSDRTCVTEKSTHISKEQSSSLAEVIWNAEIVLINSRYTLTKLTLKRTSYLSFSSLFHSFGRLLYSGSSLSRPKCAMHTRRAYPMYRANVFSFGRKPTHASHKMLEKPSTCHILVCPIMEQTRFLTNANEPSSTWPI